MSFEQNLGQTDPAVKFLTRGQGYTMYLTPTEVALTLKPKSGRSANLLMKLAGANPAARVSGNAELPGKVNYFLGNDPKKWRSNVPTFERVQSSDVYPGIDLVYYGNQRQLEYDFQVRPGADPSRIRLSYTGATGLDLDKQGDLLVRVGSGTLRQHKPVVYQEARGARTLIAASYVRKGENEIGFQLGEYDRSLPLVIDPLIVYSGFLGGGGADVGTAIATDPSGAAYVTGSTQSSNFPLNWSPFPSHGGSADVFITKINPAGSALVYSTYFGGGAIDRGYGITVDQAGNVLVVGETHSQDFPAQNNFQDFHRDQVQDAFIVKLSPSGGGLVYSSPLGGNGLDTALGVAVDGKGVAYVTGYTASPDIPIVNGFQTTSGGGGFDGFIMKLAPQGRTILYSTYVGGSGSETLGAIATNGDGSVYVSGQTSSLDFPTYNAYMPTHQGGVQDGVVLHVDTNFIGPSSLLYSTYLGGAHQDVARGIAVDLDGNAYVVGDTYSPNFPLVNPIEGGTGVMPGDNCFLTKIAPGGDTLVYSTLIGGNGDDVANAVAIDSTGAAYVAGSTGSPSWPVTIGQKPTYAGNIDGFVLKAVPDGSSLEYVKYLGGSAEDAALGIAVSAPNNAFVTGYTYSDDFRTTTPIFKSPGSGRQKTGDAFVVKVGRNDAPTVQNLGVTLFEDSFARFVTRGADNDGDVLTFTIVGPPTHGVITGTAPNFTYTPDPFFHGIDTATYRANDLAADSNLATITFTVVHVNHAPSADAVTVTTAEDTAVGITLAGSDPDGDTLAYSVVQPAAHGVITGSGANLTYTPVANYVGSDSFTYRVKDGTVFSGTATVSITVTPVNDAPVAVNQTVSVNKNESKPITLKATDVDGDPLIISLVTQPQHGTFSGTVPNLVYTPAPQYVGPDSFTFRANDGTVDSNIATVTINVLNVNHAPVAQGESYSTQEDVSLSVGAPGLLGNDSDVDADPLSIVLQTGTTHGTLTLTGNGGFTYKGNADFNGTETFTYKVSDGQSVSNLVTVTITVTPVNDAPVAKNQTISTLENTALNLVLQATDVDGDTLSYTVQDDPAHGTLTGTAPNLTYTPGLYFSGQDTFTFTVNDGFGDSNVATVTINVTHVNHAPVANNQSATTDEDVAKVVVLNGTDVDGDTLTYTLTSAPSHGKLSSITGNPSSVTYTPDANYSGTDSFTYRCSDGLVTSNVGKVTVTINPVNDPPVAQNQSITVNQNTSTSLTLTATDVDNDPLTYLVIQAPIHGTLVGPPPSMIYIPDQNYFGTDYLTFQASDGIAVSNVATCLINVSHVNQAPVAESQSVGCNSEETVNITLTASDIENDPLTFTVVGNPAHGTLTGTAPNLVYKPAKHYVGSDSFTFRAKDGALFSLPATVSITVSKVNHAPVALDQSFKYFINKIETITLKATDIDGDNLTYELVDPPTHGTVIPRANGTFTYTPQKRYVGPDSFTFRANDGLLDSNVATISVQLRKNKKKK